jgi:hypothetical protein
MLRSVEVLPTAADLPDYLEEARTFANELADHLGSAGK